MNANFNRLLSSMLALGLGAFSQLHAENSDQSKWTPTGGLLAARGYHTATLLPNGKVLIVGGFGGSGELASTELYDSKKGISASTGNLNISRTNHTATLLKSGKVLVVGGQSNGNTLVSAELYNPATGLWTVTGSLNFPRSYHTATLLKNGQVLVAGGSYLATPPLFPQGAPAGSAMDTAELYDPATGKWTATGILAAPRYEHTATLLRDGRVLVTGGLGSEGAASLLIGAEVYDPATKTWNPTGNLLDPLFSHTATLLPNGEVLVAGGKASVDSNSSHAELYDTATGTWTMTGSLHAAHNAHTATLLTDGQVMVVGGANDTGVLTDTELYNPIKGTWSTAAGLNMTHTIHTATLLPNGKILLTAGGYAIGSPAFVQSSVEVYGPTGKPKRSETSATEAAGPPPPSSPTPAQGMDSID